MVSPILSNIYLDRLDSFIERTLLPACNRGARRTPYLPYARLWQRAYGLKAKGEWEAVRKLRKQMKTMPSRDRRTRPTGDCATAVTPMTGS